MHLGSFNSTTHHFESIRVLTADEIAEFEKLRPPFTEARDRLALFRMLTRNYREWRNYLDRLLSASFTEDVDISEELNRLILNYLTFAYSIQEHFYVSFKQRFRKDLKKLEEYDDFIDRVSKASWAFAFILDYRGYVRHVGLAVRRNNRVASDTSVQIEVIAMQKH